MSHSLWYWSWNKSPNRLFKHISVASRGLEQISFVEMLYCVTVFVVRKKKLNKIPEIIQCINTFRVLKHNYLCRIHVISPAVFRMEDGLFASSCIQQQCTLQTAVTCYNNKYWLKCICKTQHFCMTDIQQLHVIIKYFLKKMKQDMSNLLLTCNACTTTQRNVSYVKRGRKEKYWEVDTFYEDLLTIRNMQHQLLSAKTNQSTVGCCKRSHVDVHRYSDTHCSSWI